MKNPENLTETQRVKFEATKSSNYQVAKVWQIRENFKDLFNTETDYMAGFYLFAKWSRDSLSNQIKEVNKVIETFKIIYQELLMRSLIRIVIQKIK